MSSAKQKAAKFLPRFIVEFLDRIVFGYRKAKVRLARKVAAKVGYNIVKHDDYYSVLPVLEEIEKTRERWDRPSTLAGLDIDVDKLRTRLGDLEQKWEADYRRVAGSWDENQQRGFGPGYPRFDSRTLYARRSRSATSRSARASRPTTPASPARPTPPTARR